METVEFQADHKTIIDAIELDARRFKDGVGLTHEALAVIDNDPLIKAIYDDTGDFMVDLANDLRKAAEPKIAFTTAFEKLDEIDRKRFVLQNALEAMKRGEEASETLGRYQNLGFFPPPPRAAQAPDAGTREKPSQTPSADPKKGEQPPPFVPRGASVLQWIHRALNKLSASVLGVLQNALRALPDFVEVEFGITFIAGVPAPTFHFKGATKTVRELLSLLQGSQ